MYTTKDRVSFSRIDHDARLSLCEVINSMQDCALFHSESTGHSIAWLSERNRAWLVSTWHVEFVRRPLMSEEFLTHTWPYKVFGVFGYRNFLMETPDKEVLAYADSKWFFFDSESGKPIRVDDGEKEVYPIEPAYEMDYSSRRVKLPAEMEPAGEAVVNPSHLDTNNHMNNGQYVRIACGLVPIDFEVKTFRAEYRNAAKLNDVLYMKKHIENNTLTVAFFNESDTPYFVCSFEE